VAESHDTAPAIVAGHGLIYCDGRRHAAGLIQQARLRHPGLVHLDPHDISDPFEPLTFRALLSAADEVAAVTGRAVLDGSRARPWDDPLWRSLLKLRPALQRRVIVVLPRRDAPERPATEALRRIESLGMSASVTPRDDDGPALRKLVLQARTAGEEDAHELVVRLLRLGEYELVHGTAGRARTAFQEATDAARESVEREPDSAARLHDLAALLDQLGDAMATTGAIDAAQTAYSEAADASARRLALEPQPQAHWGAAISLLMVGQAAQADGRIDEAIANITAAVDSMCSGPAASVQRDGRIRALIRQAELQVIVGDLRPAVAALDAVAGQLDAALETSPRRFDLRAERVDVRTRTGALRVTLDELDAATVDLEIAGADTLMLLQREPSRYDWLGHAAAVAVGHGDLALAAGDLPAAAAALEVALGLYDRLATRDPDRIAVACERARCCRRLVYATMGVARDRAAAYANVDLMATSELFEVRPSAVRHHDMALALLAEAVFTEVGDRSAVDVWREAATHAQAAVDAGPRVAAYQRTARRCLDSLQRLSAH